MKTVASSASFTCYSDIILQDDCGALAISHTAITEYLVIALLRFLAAACDSAVCVTFIDPRMGGNCQGIFVQIPTVVRREVDDVSSS